MRVWSFKETQQSLGWLIFFFFFFLNRIHIKAALGCNSERGSPQEEEGLIILWLTQTERLKQREKGRGCRENKCVGGEILNDQNSTHKTLGLMPGLLLGAVKALHLFQLPSMLHHENILKPQREACNSRRESEQHRAMCPAVSYSVPADYPPPHHHPTTTSTTHWTVYICYSSKVLHINRWSRMIMLQDIT